MAKIEWSDSLSLGIKELDGHHKELLRMMSMLLEALNKKESEDTISILLTKLREYSVFHFNAEEAFMKEIGYPQIAKHMSRHDELKRKVKALQYARFHQEELTSEDYKELLSAWLLEHILDYDFKVAKYVKERKSQPADLLEVVKKGVGKLQKTETPKSEDESGEK